MLGQSSLKPKLLEDPCLNTLRARNHFLLPQCYQNLELSASRPSHRLLSTGTISISDLSADGRSNFQLALSYYKAQKDLYDGERDALDKLQTWMTKTVASNYAQTCFDYSEGIKEWYGKLKEQVSMNEHSIKREIKASYRQAVRPLSKPPKDFEAWITNWEQVMAKGINRDIPFAKDVDEWFDDFLNAVISVKPSWVEAYRLTKAAEVELSTLSYRTLANDFRKAVKLPGPNARSSRIAKGSFGPTFAGQEAEEMAYAPDASTQGTPERRRRTRTQKRRRWRHQSLLVELYAVHVDSAMTYMFATIYSPARLPTGLGKEKRCGERWIRT